MTSQFDATTKAKADALRGDYPLTEKENEE